MTPEIIKIQEPETPEMKELESEAADWQGQFHTLKSAIESLGLEVYYDDQGWPAVKVKS